MKSTRTVVSDSPQDLAHFAVDPDHEGDALKVILAEYKALRTEIQNRSNAQTFILQVHITALTFTLGAAATTHYFPWLIFLIPIEASIFGLWYVDHASTIARLGEYIQTCIEPNVNKFAQTTGLLSWESGFYGRKVSASREKEPISFESLVFLTFGGPSMLALLAGALNIAFSLPLTRPALSRGFFASVPVFYPAASAALAFASFVVCIILLSFYIRLTRYHSRIVDGRRKSAQTQQSQAAPVAPTTQQAPDSDTLASVESDASLNLTPGPAYPSSDDPHDLS
ncbi:MAG TPA: hypothetical protein VHI51_14380 [Ktedonobacterales bacterium]|jgi:hypothetical protein|nr:hypothetical protein [Ktedonobacterales bacterium]